MTNRTFGRTLKTLRKARGWSKLRLAQACGMPWDAIHHYENGNREPKLEQIQRLARALGVEASDLID